MGPIEDTEEVAAARLNLQSCSRQQRLLSMQRLKRPSLVGLQQNRRLHQCMWWQTQYFPPSLMHLSATTACPTARTATPLTTLPPQLFIMLRPTMLLKPFLTFPSLPLASMDCPTTDCPTADCPTMDCPTVDRPLTVEFQPTPTQACPPLPTTPLPLPLQKRRRSRQLARTDFHKCA